MNDKRRSMRESKPSTSRSNGHDVMSSDDEDPSDVDICKKKIGRPGPASSKLAGNRNTSAKSKPGPASSKKINGDVRTAENQSRDVNGGDSPSEEEHVNNDDNDDDDDNDDHGDDALDKQRLSHMDGQSVTVRREIRSDLRNLIDDIKENQLAFVDSKSNKLSETLKRANTIFEIVENPREAAVDSQLVSLIAQCGRLKAQRLHTDFLVFDPANFILKITNQLSSVRLEELPDDHVPSIQANEWEVFGQKQQRLFKTSPSFNFMFGAFAREPAQPRAPRRRAQKDKETNAKTVPRELKSVKEASKETTSTEVEKIMTLLLEETAAGGNKPICYFSFVVNPHSFSQTVENIFYTSFLVKDGHAKISLDEDKLPVIEPLERPREGSEQSDSWQENKKQVVMPLTVALWKEILEVYDIEESIIPHRPPHSTTQAAGKRKHNSNN